MLKDGSRADVQRRASMAPSLASNHSARRAFGSEESLQCIGLRSFQHGFHVADIEIV
jgi:hypothetical protein